MIIIFIMTSLVGLFGTTQIFIFLKAALPRWLLE